MPGEYEIGIRRYPNPLSLIDYRPHCSHTTCHSSHMCKDTNSLEYIGIILIAIVLAITCLRVVESGHRLRSALSGAPRTVAVPSPICLPTT